MADWKLTEALEKEGNFMNTAQMLMEELSRVTGLHGLDLFVYLQIGFEDGPVDPHPRSVEKIHEGVLKLQNDLVIYNEQGHEPPSPGFLDKIAALIPWGKVNNGEPSEADVIGSIHRLAEKKFILFLDEKEYPFRPAGWVRNYDLLPPGFVLPSGKIIA